MRKYRIITIAVLVIVFFGFVSSDFPFQEFRKNIEPGKAKSVKTDITFIAGKLNISATSNLLCEGVYRYHRDYWKPEISYNEDSQVGYLKIKVDDDREERRYDDSDNTEWNIALNKNIRNDLKVKMLAGIGNIDLQSCKMDGLEFEMLAGEVKINLKNTSVPNLEFKALTGEAEIDLSGKWENDLNADIKGGVGELTIKLPSDIGIKLNITGGLGEVNAHGFDKHNRVYTNELYGKTKESLYLDISGGIGEVNIHMVD
jgi:predicted membrane protein